MQIHDHAQFMLECELDGRIQQFPGIRQFVPVVVPELFFINRDSDMVESKFFQADEIIFLYSGCACGPSHSGL